MTSTFKCLSIDHIVSQIFSYIQTPDVSDSPRRNLQADLVAFIRVNNQFRELSKRFVYKAATCHFSRVKRLDELLSSETLLKGVRQETVLLLRSLRLVVDSRQAYGLFLPGETYASVKTLLRRLVDVGSLNRCTVSGSSQSKSRFISNFACGEIIHFDALSPLTGMKSLGTLRMATIVTAQTICGLVS